jgi:hypothetical protein
MTATADELLFLLKKAFFSMLGDLSLWSFGSALQ